jgi:hypothetical protein
MQVLIPILINLCGISKSFWEIKYRQPAGQCLCLSHSLASVLHNQGFVNQAAELAKFGEEILRNGTLYHFLLVVREARKRLPKWVVMNWKSEATRLNQGDGSLDPHAIYLCVITTSDGHRSHGIAIHGGLIYDANEEHTLPLCKDALDYCSSTIQKRCTFLEFHKVATLYYTGTDKKRWAFFSKR